MNRLEKRANVITGRINEGEHFWLYNTRTLFAHASVQARTFGQQSVFVSVSSLFPVPAPGRRCCIYTRWTSTCPVQYKFDQSPSWIAAALSICLRNIWKSPPPNCRFSDGSEGRHQAGQQETRSGDGPSVQAEFQNGQRIDSGQFWSGFAAHCSRHHRQPFAGQKDGQQWSWQCQPDCIHQEQTGRESADGR